MTKFNRLKLLLFTLFLNSLNLAYSHEVINSHNEKDFQVSVFQAVNQKNWSAVNDYSSEIERNIGTENSLYYFLQGMLAFERKNNLEAINLLNRAIHYQPDFIRAKLELITIYLKNKNKNLAKELINELLSHQNIPEKIKERLRYLLNTPEYKHTNTRNPFSAQIAIGYQYQDNINQTADGDSICTEQHLTSGICLQKWTATEQDSAQGVFLRTELSYQKNIHPAHVWLNQLSINHKQYVNEPQYNELSTQIYSRYQYQQPRYQLHIGPKIYYENSGITGHNYGVGIRWGGIWQPSQASQWLLIAGQEIKQLSIPNNPYANGSHFYHQLIITRPLFFGDFFQLTEFSHHYHRDTSKDHHQIQFITGVDWQSIPYVEPNISVSGYQQKFQNFNTILQTKRRDRGVGVHVKIKTKHWQLAGFTPTLAFSHHYIKSNVDWLYSHRRNHVQLFFERRFQ